MKSQFYIPWVAIVIGGCLDVNLLDEMRADGTSGTDTVDQFDTGDNDTEIPDGPPDTDSSDTAAPSLSAPNCGSGERLEDVFCISEDTGTAALRFNTDEPAEVAPSPPTDVVHDVVSVPWSTSHHVVLGGLTHKTHTSVTLSVSDVNGNGHQFSPSVIGKGGIAVVVTEILADPFGPEPDQEFIEITNLESEIVDLSGWMIDDNGDRNGDLIPDGTTLPASGIAVLVSPNYDVAGGLDPAPDPSASLVRLKSSLCSNGLKNSEAETIELYDATGNLVSSFSGLVSPSEGHGTTRIVAEAPDGDPLAFELDPNGTSTPGLTPTL